LTHFTSDAIFDFSWSRDGKHLTLSRGVTASDAVLIRGLKGTAANE